MGAAHTPPGGRVVAAPAARAAGAEYDPLVAQPGESDEAFARRLAAMYSTFGAARAAGAQDPGRPAAPSYRAQPAAGEGTVPSAPPRDPSPATQRTDTDAAAVHPSCTSAWEQGSAAAPDDEDLCVICLTQPRQVGFLHGSSVHKCVCTECAALTSTGQPCPMCRAPITAILNVY